MGKNKNKNSVFKVAGARSLKVKAKAKPVDLNLKKIAPLIKEKVAELDAKLATINDIVRKSDAEKPKKASSALPKPSQPSLPAEAEQQTIDDLAGLQCN